MVKKLVFLTVVALVAFSVHLIAQPDEAKAFHKYIGKLNLTEEQKKDVDKIRTDMEKQVIAQNAKLATARVDLHQLFKADNPDRSAIEKKLNDIASLGVQLHLIKIDAWFSINKLLTPEQQKTWKKVLENAPAMHRKMMDHRGKHPMPMHSDKPGSE